MYRRGLSDVAGAFEGLADQLAELRADVEDQQQVLDDQDTILADDLLQQRRDQYRARLRRLRYARGIDVDPDTEAEEIDLHTPEGYEDRQIDHMGRTYRRLADGARAAESLWSGQGPPPIRPIGGLDAATARKAVGIATRKGLSFQQALWHAADAD